MNIQCKIKNKQLTFSFLRHGDYHHAKKVHTVLIKKELPNRVAQMIFSN